MSSLPIAAACSKLQAIKWYILVFGPLLQLEKSLIHWTSLNMYSYMYKAWTCCVIRSICAILDRGWLECCSTLCFLPKRYFCVIRQLRINSVKQDDHNSVLVKPSIHYTLKESMFAFDGLNVVSLLSMDKVHVSRC